MSQVGLIMLDPDAHVEPLVTLLGGGPLNFADLFAARAIAPCLVAADGGAQHAKTANLALDRIIGDMDSLGDSSHWQATGTKITHLPEQDSTDFEKCLYTLSADLIIGLGFLGGRLDHELAALSALAAYPARAVILIGPEDLVFLAPLTLALDLEPGARVSFFPLGPVTGLTGDHRQLRCTQHAGDLAKAVFERGGPCAQHSV